MKKSKFIIIAIVLLLIICICSFLFINRYNSDSMRFKREYESLNGTKSKSGKTIRSITIDSSNPIVYSTAEEINKMIDNKETFAVYFGFAECPWCRSVLPTLLEVCEDLEIDKVYYVDILDIRDIKELDENGGVITSREGTKAYYKLLDKLDTLLDSYTLETDDGEEVATLEKRIYAPNVVSIVSGKPHSLTTGISDSQDDGYMELTDDMKKETYNKFKCTLECISVKNLVCSSKAC